MKSLAERKKERAKDRKEHAEASAFEHANFLRNGRTGKNDPGKDSSKGSTEGTAGDGTKPNAADQDKGEGEGGGSTGGNANKPAKPVGDAEKARQEAARRQGGQGWGQQGAGGNPGTPGGSQSPNPQS